MVNSFSRENPMSSDENTYIIDTESEIELVRLLRQSELLNRHVGLLPDAFVPSSGAVLLDLACGPGGWVLDVNDQFPEMNVVGVDISDRQLAFARAQAKARGGDFVYFKKMNILDPFDFPDHSIDFIHARFLLGVMRTALWPKLIQECFRVMKPGGLIRLTETNPEYVAFAPMFDRIASLLAMALWKAGKTYSEKSIALGPMLGRFLKQGGYEVVDEGPSFINISYGSEFYDFWVHDRRASFEAVKPFILKYSELTSHEYDQLAKKAEKQVSSTAFRGHWFITSVVGRKPVRKKDRFTIVR